MKRKHSRFRLFYLIILLFVFSCSSTPIPSSGPVDVPEEFFGMAHAARTRTPLENLLLDQMGVRWARDTFSWGEFEREMGEFDFSHYDVFVDAAKKEGIKIIGVLGFVTPWIFPEGKSKRYISKENMPHFLNYVEATVRHFQGRVDVWEIWNEPNLSRFWRGSDREFIELTRQAAQRIKEADPDAYVIGGVFWRVPKSFIRNMINSGATGNLDGIAFHPYAINPTGTMRLYDKFANILTELNYSGDVWITEVGHPTSGWYPTRASMAEMPSYIVKTMSGAAARGARTLIWYQLRDRYNEGEAPNNWDSEMFFGLVHQDFSKKSGAWAYALCARYLPGSRYVPELPIREKIPSRIVSFCFMEGSSGNNTLIIWNDSNNTEKIILSLSSVITFHDISTGLSYTVHPGEIPLKINKVPLFITWQGSEIPRLSL